MGIRELFVDLDGLPNRLTNEDQKKLFKEFKNGSSEAREKLITHNIKLVIFEITHKLQTSNCDKQELVSVGLIGLIKAVDTFDYQKGFEFSTYAAKCIDNEIILFLRKYSRDAQNVSLDGNTVNYKDGTNFKIIDTISSGTNIAKDMEKSEILKIVRGLVYQLPLRDSEIMLLHFGFYDGIMHSQKSIASRLNLTPSTVSRAIGKNVEKLGQQLNEMGVINLPMEFDDIKHSTKDRCVDTKSNKLPYIAMPLLEEEQILLDIWKHFQLSSVAQSNGIVKEEKQEFTAEHYLDILKVLRQPKFKKYLKMFTIKEAIILLLKMRYFEDRNFSSESVAAFFKLSIEEYTTITINALKKYREKVYKIMGKSFNRSVSFDESGQKTV